MEKLVFIIDDDPVYLKFMQGHFNRMEGLATEVYATGEEALANLSTKKPFLIILDHHLKEPAKDWLFYLKKIRKKNSKIPIIYITADTTPSLWELVEKSKVQGFIYKNETFLVYLRTALDEIIQIPEKKNFLRKIFR